MVAQDSDRSPANTDDIVRQAEVSRQAGRPEEAIRLYRRGLEVNPAWADGWWNLALLSYDQGKYVETEKALDRVIAIKPDWGPAHALMGVCLYNRGEFDKALENLQHAPEQALGGDRPLFRSVCYYMAAVMIRKSKFGSAILTLASFAEDGDASEDALLVLGLAMLRVPVPPEELNPQKKDLVLRSGRAAFLAQQHKFREAEREYHALLAAYPHTPNVHYEYGTYLFASTLYEKAIAEFQQEIKLFPQNPLANIYIALAHLRTGRFTEGLSYARKAVALDPSAYAAQYALGDLLQKTGDLNGALEHLELAAKLGPKDEAVHYALLKLYARLGRKSDVEREEAIFQQIQEGKRSDRKGVSFAHQLDPGDIGD